MVPTMEKDKEHIHAFYSKVIIVILSVFHTGQKYHIIMHIIKKSKRSQVHKSGLDYAKIVILSDTKYIDTKDTLIDKDEYNETMIYLEKIKSESLKYVEDYIAHIKRQNVLYSREFKRRYEFSSLNYFHAEMGI